VDKVFYGQVQYFIVIEPAAATPDGSTTPHDSGAFLLASILPCKLLDQKETGELRIPCYRQHEALEVVDIRTIEGLVGRVHDRHRNFWALIEREGEFWRLQFADDQDDA
jgi:hypothetical protein